MTRRLKTCQKWRPDKAQEKDDGVFDFIDKAYAQGQEDHFIKKLRDTLCFDLDSRIRKFTRDLGRSPDSALYERFVSHLEGQILYLEEELRKKDTLIEKLMGQNLVPTNVKCVSCSTKKSSNIDKNHLKEQPNLVNDQKKSDTLKNDYTPNGLIDFDFDDNISKNITSENKFSNDAVDKKSLNNDQKPLKRQNVYICGDSLLNGIDGDGVSTKKYCTVVKSFGGSTSRDMVDYIKPAARKKPDKIIIHVGTNDISKSIDNTSENLDLVVKSVHELSPETQIFFSELCLRNDIAGSFSKVKQKNEEIRKFCQERNIGLVTNENIDNSCLAKKKLHMNQKGLKRLALNFKNFLGKM